jgi:hypothetical protein
LLRDVPFSAIYWPCYEFLRPQRYNFVETFLAGAFAGTVASTVTLPMDVIKTRLQIELGENIVNSSNNGNTRFVSRVMICPYSNLINMSKGGVDNKFDFKELKNATGFVSSA